MTQARLLKHDFPVRGFMLVFKGYFLRVFKNNLRKYRNDFHREAPVRFGYGLGVEGFERFRFSVLAVPLQKGFFCASVQFDREGRFRFRFLETLRAQILKKFKIA